MEEDLSLSKSTPSERESIASSTNILSSSENTNNENREKELITQSHQDEGVRSEGAERGEDERLQTEGELEGIKVVVSKPENVPRDENREEELLTGSRPPDKGVKSEKTENAEKKEFVGLERPPHSEGGTDGSKSTKPENPSSDEYAKYVTYNDEGEAIYTDPKTNYQYKWSQEKNSWETLDNNTSSEQGSNPFENEHYRWCSETNQWIPKIQSSTAPASDVEKLENEFYKWDKESNQWIPKTQSSDVTYNYEDGVHTYTDKDGTIYFWDVERKAWFPKIDDDFMARYQMNYGFIDNTSSSHETTGTQEQFDNSSIELSEDKSDNLKSSVQTSETLSGASKRKALEPPKWFDMPAEQNTKVYVSNLPLDITEEEFVQVMSKCGLLMRDPKTQKNKVKLYAESDGQLKGDGLCDYIKVESVDLALNLLDGYDVRGHKIKVQQAKFQMRGEYNPALKPKKKKKDKEKLQKMKEKLFDWRPEKMRGERSKHERQVIIKNLFSPELFDKEVHLIIDYQKDLREECAKCGTVRKVVIYDRHSEGVAQIMMSDPEEADLVVQMMNGRFFGKRKLTAELWDGKTKYKVAETEAEVKERISNWDKFLESELKDLKKKAETESSETPTEISIEKSMEKTAEKSPEKPSEEPMEIPAEKLTETPVDKPMEKQIENPTDIPIMENPTEKQLEMTAEKSMETPAEKSLLEPAEIEVDNDSIMEKND